MKNIFSFVGAGLIGGLMVVGATQLLNSKINVSPHSNSQFVSQNTPIVAGAMDLSQAAASASPSVVFIEAAESEASAQRNRQDDPFTQFFGFQQPAKRGTGSGVILSSDGYIVTNNHVVDFADEVKVTLPDERKFMARVIGTDPRSDLAVLKIATTGLPAIQKGNSDVLRIGEWVLAIGYPYDIGTTVTAGIISAKDKKLRGDNSNAIEDFLQTDAVVNPGNSGGALVDVQGRLVGINSAIQSRTGSYEGYSFAIPISLVDKTVENIIKNGKNGITNNNRNGLIQGNKSNNPRGVRLGVQMVNDEDFLRVAKDNEIDVKEGVFVDAVQDGSNAQFGGILPKDVIIKVDGDNIKKTTDLKSKLLKYKVGDTVRITVVRNGDIQDLKLTLRPS